MEERIASAILQKTGQKLLRARVDKGLTQRALSKRIGVPQAHISKIEQGRVDIRLSSLVEIARALDLDIELLPRRAIPAIEGTLRAFKNDAGEAVQSRAVATLTQHELALERIENRYAQLRGAQELLATIRNLKLLPFEPHSLNALERALSPLEGAELELALDFNLLDFAKLLGRTNRSLRRLRNSLAHAPVATPRSAGHAYRLDDESEDG